MSDPPPPPGSDSQIRQRDRGICRASVQLQTVDSRPTSIVGTFVGNAGQNRYRSVSGAQIARPLESHWRTGLRTYPAMPRYMGETTPPTTHMQEVPGSSPGASTKSDRLHQAFPQL